ncbi:hypothetical protein OAO52_06975 [Flavobacteriaceae bacterium]|jgi:hypothetical protein|nr:hypothetical protein [Flavobacteriaceae bacterium]
MLKLFSKINFFRVIVCGILAITIGFQALSQAFVLNFDIDYSIECNDTSDSSETDIIDGEENEQEKQLKQHYFIRPKSTFFSKNYTSYQINRQPIVSIDINLPPPQEDTI